MYDNMYIDYMNFIFTNCYKRGGLMKRFATNKFFKSLLSMFLVVLMALPINVFASTNSSQKLIKTSTIELDNSKKTAEVFALKNILKVVNEVTNEGWTENTKISDAIITYDLDGNENGYIFNLKTKDKETGYIQILKLNSVYYVNAYTFQGRHYLDKMIASYKTKNNNFKDEYKIIYNGNIDFIINEDTMQKNKYYNLTTEQTMQYDKSQLQIKYNKIEKNIIENVPSSNSNSFSKLSAATSTTGVKKYVLNANNADLVEMDDFSGRTLNGQLVDNHCSPTAGTNLIKYWANRRGVTQLFHDSDWWVFSSLCVNMSTKFPQPNAGTSSANFLAGLRNYSTNTRSVSYSGDEWWGDGFLESCTFSKAKSYIDANVPFHLDLVGHSVVCFGYDTVSGTDKLIINTGWDKLWTFQAFSSFDIDYYQYVRWN